MSKFHIAPYEVNHLAKHLLENKSVQSSIQNAGPAVVAGAVVAAHAAIPVIAVGGAVYGIFKLVKKLSR